MLKIPQLGEEEEEIEKERRDGGTGEEGAAESRTM